MDFATYAFIALLTSLSALVFVRRLAPWRTILRYRAGIDVLFTISLFAVFAGTLGGALVAAMGGLFLSIMLGIARAVQKGAHALHTRL